MTPGFEKIGFINPENYIGFKPDHDRTESATLKDLVDEYTVWYRLD